MRRSREPVLWALFSSGGMLTALVLPALIGVLLLAPPLGWIPPLRYEQVLGLVTHPIGRLLIIGFVSLSLFHWAHRFRYTLYDGLQVYHLNTLIAFLTYGLATVTSGVTVYIVLGV